MTITHATFTLERTYPAPLERVWAAFADPAAKALWFKGPDDWDQESGMDFRVGGRDFSRGGPVGGPVSSFVSEYKDIVEHERIVYTYEMELDGRHMSVSVATFEFESTPEGTHLVLTEMGAFFDGIDSVAGREHGTSELLDALGRSLAQDYATT
jgi:uncharacterized protein YndB with AHSA1/START domain